MKNHISQVVSVRSYQAIRQCINIDANKIPHMFYIIIIIITTS